jgi:hypothetical protein
MADQRLVQAQEAFEAALPGGRQVGVNPGDLFEQSDPIVKGREHLFGAVRVRSSGARHAAAQTRQEPAAGHTETASAAPGSRRAPARPARSAKASAADAAEADSPEGTDAAEAEDGDKSDA